MLKFRNLSSPFHWDPISNVGHEKDNDAFHLSKKIHAPNLTLKFIEEYNRRSQMRVEFQNNAFVEKNGKNNTHIKTNILYQYILMVKNHVSDYDFKSFINIFKITVTDRGFTIFLKIIINNCCFKIIFNSRHF